MNNLLQIVFQIHGQNINEWYFFFCFYGNSDFIFTLHNIVFIRFGVLY